MNAIRRRPLLQQMRGRIEPALLIVRRDGRSDLRLAAEPQRTKCAPLRDQLLAASGWYSR